MLLGLAAALIFGPLEGNAEHFIELWPNGTPESHDLIGIVSIVERGDAGGKRDRFATNVSSPNLAVFPALAQNGQALLIVPGGGYRRVVFDKEGYDIAEWYRARGVTCFVLTYRLPGEGWTNRSDVPLQDAQRALRIIRSEAKTYGYDNSRIGVMGFSAGGHLAATLATRYDQDVYSHDDTIDEFSARPDFGIFVYPVVSMDPAIAHPGSRENLLGPDSDADAGTQHSIELNVSGNTPPVLIVHAADDRSVPVENSLRLHVALQSAGVDADLHVFSEGGHGFGLRKATDKPISEWPNLAWRWMQEH